MYEIHPSVPTKVAYIGYWSDRMGLRIKETNKWERRHDLQVCNQLFYSFDRNTFINSFQGAKFTIQSQKVLVWVTGMEKKPDTIDEYDFSGPLPDVWFALQVSLSDNRCFRT